MELEKSPKIPKIFECIKCDYICSNKKDYKKHLITLKHNLELEKSPKIPKIFECIKCDYMCSNKKDYKKHLITPKHNLELEKSPKIPKIFECIKCDKLFKTYCGLSKHKKKCNNDDNQLETLIKIITEQNKITTDQSKIITEQNKIITEQGKITTEQNKLTADDNKEFKNLILEVCKNMQQPIINNTTNTTNNNKIFNLNIFLNETCKDAMEIKDFVQELKFEISDLDMLSKKKFKTGYANIISKALKKMDISKRPIHCSDSKRKVIHLMDDHKWVIQKGEIEDYELMNQYFNKVVKNCIGIIPEWRKKHPEYSDSHSNESTLYQKILSEVVGFEYNTMKEGNIAILSELVNDITIDKNL
jgi:uncharacterized C2H2 Zn-finger protein